MQSGLSWKTILDKRENFRKAFANFDPVKVAAYTDADIERLMSDAGIIRNRRKIEAIVNNARTLPGGPRRSSAPSTTTSGSSRATRPYAETTSRSPPRPPSPRPYPKTLKARGFKFMGPIVVYSHMQATGQVNDHHPTCFRVPKLVRKSLNVTMPALYQY